MTPERLAELKVRLAVGDGETWDMKELFDYIDEDTKELFVYIDQLRVDAERWRTVLDCLNATPSRYGEFSLRHIANFIGGDAKEKFTAAIDALRTQKAPG